MGAARKFDSIRPYVNLGHYLRAARERVGLTQREVAQRLGYSSPQFISNAECGISLIPLSKLVVLKKMYGLDAKDLTDQILTDEKARILIALTLPKRE